MAYKGNGWLLMIFLAFVDVNYLSHAADNSSNIFLKHPDVKISVYGLNSVNLAWGPEVTAEIANFDVCYNFSYQFLDKATWITEILMENYRIINLRLHPGFTASVSNALCDDNTIILESKQTEIVYLAPYVYIDSVSCVIYNLSNLNCTWDLKKDAPEDTNYSFALRLSSKYLACKQYFTKQGKNTGCLMKDLLSTCEEGLHYKIRIQLSNNVCNFTKTFSTKRIEILNPPINISVSSVNGNTKINWYTPPSMESLPKYCFQYQIEVIETQTNLLFKDNITCIAMEEYKLSDMDKDKQYSVKIRARKKYCAKSKYWGEWSKPVYIGKDKKIFPTWLMILAIVIVSVSLVILVVFLFKRYMKILHITVIPDPSKKIKLWLISKENSSEGHIAIHNEQSVPITEIEIVTTIRDAEG